MLPWRRTLYTIWFSQFIAVVGFYFVVPFIPYYIEQLGITDPAQVALWSGLAATVQALSMALVAPLWGALADRFGRKMMLMRATLAGSIIMALMGCVTTVPQLIFLRLMQGVFTGTIAASTTLVAAVVPRDKSGWALGSLQTAIFMGTSLGPLLGGVVGDTFGYRPSFWITGVLLLISGLMVSFLVHEDFQPVREVRSDRHAYGPALRLLLASGGALLAVFCARLLFSAGARVLTSVLPLYVQTIVQPGAHVATLTGIIFGGNAVGGAFGSPLIGKLGDRIGHRRLLILSGIGVAVFYVPQAFATSVFWLTAWQLLCGFAAGGTMATLTAMLHHHAPCGREGMVFGLDASATGIANSLGPMLGAAVAAGMGLSAPFLVSAVVLALGTGLAIWRVYDAVVPAGPLSAGPGQARPA